jgi:hypothetical protein
LVHRDRRYPISWTCVRTAHLARADHLGPQTNLHTGDVYELTPAHFAELAALRVERITHPVRDCQGRENDQLPLS